MEVFLSKYLILCFTEEEKLSFKQVNGEVNDNVYFWVRYPLFKEIVYIKNDNLVDIFSLKEHLLTIYPYSGVHKFKFFLLLNTVEDIF